MAQQVQKIAKIIRRNEVEALVGLARSTLYKRISEQTFPKPIPLAPRAVGWIESEVSAWLDNQIAQRRDTAEVSTMSKTANKLKKLTPSQPVLNSGVGFARLTSGTGPLTKVSHSLRNANYILDVQIAQRRSTVGGYQ